MTTLPFFSEFFSFLDSDEKCTITHEDAAVLASAVGFSHNSPEEVFAMVRAMDSSCTGRITKEQAVRVLSKRVPEVGGPEELWRAFVHIDTTSSGRVSTSDLLQQLSTDRSFAPRELSIDYMDDSISYDAWRLLFTSA